MKLQTQSIKPFGNLILDKTEKDIFIIGEHILL